MRLLLDTHALFWFLKDDARLTPVAKQAIESPSTVVYVSAVSAWEISVKVQLGKWPEARDLVGSLNHHLEELELAPLSVTIEHALRAGAYTQAHRDPFDRLLASQAQSDQLILVTSDKAFEAFPIQTLW